MLRRTTLAASRHIPDICCGGKERLHRSSKSGTRLAVGEGQCEFACKHDQVHVLAAAPRTPPVPGQKSPLQGPFKPCYCIVMHSVQKTHDAPCLAQQSAEALPAHQRSIYYISPPSHSVHIVLFIRAK